MLAGWKTLIFSVGVAVIGVLSATDWVQLLGSTKAGYVVTAIGILSAVLRFATSTPVMSSEPAKP